jgi:iron complex outermembrane receptor protein
MGMNWKAGMAALLCGCAAVPAFAQDTPPPGAPAPAPDAGPIASNAGDIVVTAQRRNERLRDVPISITALTQETLEKSGVQNSLDIARLTPGVQLTQYGLQIQPSIRGISASGAGVGNSPNVAMYVDGVYQPNSASMLVDMPDVEAVEVLKGPQGTYYGQNAAGGAIIIRSIEPTFRLQGKLSASYGNYNDIQFRGYVTGPLSDSLAVGLAAAWGNKDSFRKNILTGKRNNGVRSRLVRAKILFKPSSDFSALFTAYYSYRKDWDTFEGHNIDPLYNGRRGLPLAYAYGAVQNIFIPRAHGHKQTDSNIESFNQMKTWGVSLRNRLNTGIGEFSTITSYTKFDEHVIADTDASPANLGYAIPDFSDKVFIQELNYVSKNWGGLTISAGAFYMNAKDDFVPQVFFGNSICPTNPPGGSCSNQITQYPVVRPPDFTLGVFGYNHKDSYAAYLGAAYEVTPKLTISVSGRYSYETQHVGTFKYFTPTPPPGAKALPDLRGGHHFKKFTPSASIRYAVADRANVYFSYTQGFKSGLVGSADAFTTQCPGPPNEPAGCTHNPSIKPETVTSYEIGFKGRVLNNLNVNFALFHYDWKNIQVFFYNPPTGFYQNAASARINGIDFDFNWRATRELTISGGGSYLDHKFKKYPKAAAYVPLFVPDGQGGTIPFGYTNAPFNANGTPLLRTPKWSGNIAVNYTNEMSSGELSAYLSLAYQSRVRFDVVGLTGTKAYASLNGEIGFAPAALKGARFVLWGKNLGNVHYIVSSLQTAYGLNSIYGAPRQFGGRIEFKF